MPKFGLRQPPYSTAADDARSARLALRLLPPASADWRDNEGLDTQKTDYSLAPSEQRSGNDFQHDFAGATVDALNTRIYKIT